MSKSVNKQSKYDYPVSELLKRFSVYLFKHKRVMIFDLICASFTTICDLTLPMIMRFITNDGITGEGLLSIQLVLKLGALYFVLRLVDVLSGFYMAYNGHVMGAHIENDMRSDAYKHLQKLSFTYYNNTKIGQIMGRITNDLFDVTEFAHHCPEEFLIAIIKTIISFVILIRIDVTLTLIVFAIIPVMLFVCVNINLKFRAIQRAQRVQIGELNANIEEALLGQKVVKAFTNEELEEARFEKNNLIFLKIKRDYYKVMAWFHTGNKIFEALLYLVVLVFGSLFLVNGRINAGDLVAYLLYISTLITTIKRIIEFSEQFQRGITGIDRFLQIMDSDIEIFDSENARELKDVHGDIEFKDVTFEYPDDHNEVFKNLNLKIKAGEKVAIVGPSGGGKSTLLNLIPRFYDILSGEIILDGDNIKNYTLKSLRKNIGMVQQDVYLFSGTVYDNISYGRPDATEEEVKEAARRAGALEFVEELKDGFNTYIGERGVKLSGGQKQRISIARVFLKNPPVIILDEATSALDNESEFKVAEALQELSKGRTTITVAHRLSTIQNSDRILVLTEEGITEEGTHQELIEKNGMYRKFYDMANKLS